MPAAFTEGRYIMCIVLLIVMQCIFHDIKSSHMSFHASKKRKKKKLTTLFSLCKVQALSNPYTHRALKLV